jgi:hypothetical protein
MELLNEEGFMVSEPREIDKSIFSDMRSIGKRYDDPPRGGLLSAVEKLVNEPPPPPYFH